MPIPKPGFFPELNIAVGRSARKGRQPATIEAAIEDAHARARKVLKKGRLHYRLIDVFAVGTNPISEYVVQVEVGVEGES